MDRIETFAQPAMGPAVAVSRRRVLQVLSAAVVASQFAGVGDGVLASASAAVADRQPPPAYDRIVGLL